MTSHHRTNDERVRRDPLAAAASLFGAALAGTAASIIHGAFDRIALDARRSAAPGTAKNDRKQADGTAQDAHSPAHLPARSWWDIIKSTVSEIGKDRVLAVAGGVTFYGLLSLFPAITVLVSVYGLFADPQSIGDHIRLLSSFLPEGAMSIIGDQVQRITNADTGQLSLALVFGLLVALWSANAAMKAVMDALNIAYGVEEKRSFIWLTIVSLLFTLSAIIGLLVMFAVVALVPIVLQMFWLGSTVDFLIWAGRWPAAFVLVILALAVLYQWGPDRHHVQWRWITPGSFLAAVLLLALSMLFSWYAANFGKFNETYGSLGAVIAFMTWMWLSATIIMVGAELNSEIEQKAGKDPSQGDGGPAKA
jgi:membrane protein